MSDFLQYFSFNSNINPNFWYKLSQFKLDLDMLDESERCIWGYYSNLQTQSRVPYLDIDCTSFNKDYERGMPYLPFHGVLLNKNMIGAFKDCDKSKLVDEYGERIWSTIKNGEALRDPSLINMFIFLSFADLKKYHYYYWLAFPGLQRLRVTLFDKYAIGTIFSDTEITNIMNSYNEMEDVSNRTFFIIKKGKDTETKIYKLHELIKFDDIENNLSDFEDLYFAFSDPCFINHPGWPLRNYLLLLMYYSNKIHGQVINVVSFRLENTSGTASGCRNSVIYKIKLPEENCDIDTYVHTKQEDYKSCWIGWEKNERGNFGPRFINLSTCMDPKILANDSSDLNLKLMKWTLIPNINLEKMKSTKCLLLGSGTLGCSVARNLLAWGFRHITFVDSGNVSYSNPVRQSLFTHEDCFNGGKPKAKAAADNLKKILPVLESSGYKLTIPMPGHPLSPITIQNAKEETDKLTELIASHDVIFLMTDSRESRWLPTLLSAYFKKTVINTALGFESFLVMRHGVNPQEDTCKLLHHETIPDGFVSIRGDRLGCYFCNDVTAPGDSTSDRTLDQQCTVTRPAVSNIAAGLAVELAVSILQHPNGPYANAFYTTTNDIQTDRSDECILGILPHSIRGFLSSYSIVLPATERFKKCIACSEVILQEYAKRKFEFIMQVLDSSKYLEDITGLSEIQNELDAADVWSIDSDESKE